MEALKEQRELLDILGKYSPVGQDLPKLLLDKERKIRTGDMIVPFLGVQGAGKSTILNALIGEDILPVEADETTCVPVEIRYGAKPLAEVHFADGKPTQAGNLDRRALSDYVDNNANPGNEKKVARIVLYRDHPLLASGLVVVDLPGVGSMTRANENTTMQYIKNLCAAVFLISESPPVGQAMSGFLSSVWAAVAKAYFVQNAWDDDSEDEVRDGLEHNRLVLGEIAQKIHAPEDFEILPVNAYLAARGAFSGNEALVEQSGLLTVRETLAGFAENFRRELEDTFLRQVEKAAEAAAQEVEVKIRRAQMTRDEVLQELRAQKDAFERTSNEIQELTDDIDRSLKRAGRKVASEALRIATHYAELMYADTCKTIDAGVYDGEQLSRVVTDNQATRAGEATVEAADMLESAWEPIGQKFQQIQDLRSEERMRTPNAVAFSLAEDMKWEEGISVAAKLGGAAGGTILGTMAAGAVTGAWAGPIGIGVGVAVSALGAWIGDAIRKNKRRDRAHQAKHALEGVVDEFRDRIRDAIEDSWNDMAETAQEELRNYADDRRRVLKAMQDEIHEIEKRGTQIETEKSQMEQDLAYLREERWK